MTDYKKLVEALRVEPFEVGSVGVARVMQDAAAAIEALQADQKKTVTQIFGEEHQEWEEYCTGLMNRIKELETKKPKRGKWVGVSPMVDTRQCSICGYNVISEEMQTPYCPWCGAKMEAETK